jgi:glutamate-5-semialdehyde dehydrogenase
MGVIGVIYESRPNVTSDSAGICIKSGNAVILRGGSDAIHSNVAICKVLRDALVPTQVPSDAVQIINSTSRKDTEELMTMREYIDVLIPRGGADLSKPQSKSHGSSHRNRKATAIYVEEDADYQKPHPSS